MPIYVDPLMYTGWNLRGTKGKSCHLFTEPGNLAQLHEFASQIGLKRHWFQDESDMPHYDLTEKRRKAALKLGAIEWDRTKTVQLLRFWRLTKNRKHSLGEDVLIP